MFLLTLLQACVNSPQLLGIWSEISYELQREIRHSIIVAEYINIFSYNN